VIRMLLFVLLIAVVVNAASKTCIFLHGAGKLLDLPPTTTYHEYWGNLDQITTQCTAHWFNHHDTTHRRFDDPILTSGYCTVAALGVGSQGTVIKDTIIFTHSMANLILATAFKLGVCSLDPSSSWYALSPPLYGSKAATKIQQVCSNPTGVNLLVTLFALDQNFCSLESPLVQYGNQNGLTNFSSAMPDVTSIRLAGAQLLASSPSFVRQITTAISSAAWDATALATNAVLNVVGVLDPSIDVVEPPTEPPIYVNAGWLCLQPTDPALVGLDQIVNSKIKGGICGKSPFGLISDDSLEMMASSAYVGFGEPNDGQVALPSCQGVSASSVWDNDPQSSFYLHHYNHLDTTGRNGGGPLLAWFASRQ